MSYITEQNQPPGWYPESTGETSGDVTVRPLSVVENGTYTAPAGSAYNPVDVNVEAEITTEALTVVENGTYTAPSGKAYTPVNVNVPVGATTQPLTVTENGTYTAPSGTAYSPVTVDVGAGAESQGLFDLSFNFTDARGNTISGSVTNNAVSNFSSPALYSPPLLLKQPITINTGDEIEIYFEDIVSGSGYVDIGLLYSIYYTAIAGTQKLAVAQNTSFPRSGSMSVSSVYSGNSAIVNALFWCDRGQPVTNASFTIHLKINGVLVF